MNLNLTWIKPDGGVTSEIPLGHDQMQDLRQKETVPERGFNGQNRKLLLQIR